MTDCRRCSERAFGRLKGRWAFCTRTKTYGNPCLVQTIIEACCGLHNWLAMRKTEFDGKEVQPEGWQRLPRDCDGFADELAAGPDVRQTLRKWVDENEVVMQSH